MAIGSIGSSYGLSFAPPYIREREEKQREELGLQTPIEEKKEAERKKRLGIEDPDADEHKTRYEKQRDCETCKNRKYQDGSDEMVSFKNAAHISPTAAASAVRAHEMEHVSNAYAKASESGGKVLRASVSIHTSVCPECGRVYVSGGTTHTCISTPTEQPDRAQRASEEYSKFNMPKTETA